MSKKPTTLKSVETLKHDANRRKNILTAECQSVPKPEERKPVTVLYPRKAADPAPVIAPLLDGTGEGARIEADGRRYRLFIRRNAEAIALDGCQSDADLVALFEDASGHLHRAVRVGGTHLSVNGQVVAQEITTVL